MAGDIKWIKVITDIFEDEKVKLIKSMPEGRTLVLIWFQLLVQAGKTNAAGWIYLSEGCAYTPSMLSTLFNETQQMVELALKLFSTKPFEMIDLTDDGLIYIPNWEKHQNVESMDKIREKERLRKARQRDKQKALMSRDSHGTGHGTSLQCHATEIEKELELDLELEKEIKNTTTSDFYKLSNAFLTIHEKLFASPKDEMYMTQILGEGIPVDFVIDTMSDIHLRKEGEGGQVNTFSYYMNAIRERFFNKDKPKQTVARGNVVDWDAIRKKLEEAEQRGSKTGA